MVEIMSIKSQRTYQVESQEVQGKYAWMTVSWRGKIAASKIMSLNNQHMITELIRCADSWVDEYESILKKGEANYDRN